MTEIITESPAPSTTPSIRQSSEKYCHACSTVLHVTAGFCPRCGATQSKIVAPVETDKHISTVIPDAVFCRGCAQPIHKSANTCPKCGALQSTVHVTASSATYRGADRLTSGLLGIFLGGFGVHKFYLGNIVLGFVYLIFFWTFIPAIIGFIEGVYYLTLSDEEFYAKYGK